MGSLIKIKQSQDGPKKGRIIAVALLIVGLLIAGGLVYKNLQNKPQAKNTPEATQAAEKTMVQNYEAAWGEASGGNYEGGQAKLDQSVNSAKDNFSKVSAYTNKALLALNTQHYEDAMKSAQAAEDLVHSKSTSKLIGMIYEKQGDKANAAKYYQITLDRYTEQEKKSPEAGIDYDNDRAALKRVSGNA